MIYNIYFEMNTSLYDVINLRTFSNGTRLFFMNVDDFKNILLYMSVNKTEKRE
jgi:hypothetical protein